MSERYIAVLGCGPAGLLACHAARLAGFDVDVISKRQKSVLPGAQYLHDPIPEVTTREPDGVLNYVKIGTREGYAQKVYGDPDARCSWDQFPVGQVVAWSLHGVYESLWELYAERIIDTELHPGDLDALELSGYDAVISTIPAPVLCRNPDHAFGAAEVYIADHAWRECTENTIVYHGDPIAHWYRTSNIFGHEATESTTPMPGAVVGVKPTGTNCDCRASIRRAGRFGTWQKGVLVHHSFEQTRRICEDIALGGKG